MARRLSVKATWLRAECEAGRLPHVCADDQILFDPETVEQVLLARAQGRRRRRLAADGNVNLLGARELAELLDISPSWVRRQARDGRLPSFRYRKRYFFSIGAVLDELRARSQEVLR